jgi:hypothetical protein
VEVSAGASPPAPENFGGGRIVHAMDGDGTAVCSGLIPLEHIDHHRWAEAPADERCRACEFIMEAGRST